jgi:cbb3-type cytochrome oxidase subunit 3
MAILTVLLSACSLANQWIVYYAGNRDSFSPWISRNDSWGMLIAWGTVLAALISVGYIIWLTGRTGNARVSSGSKTVKNNAV